MHKVADATTEREQIKREMDTKAAIDSLFVAVYLCDRAGWADLAGIVGDARLAAIRRLRAEQDRG